MTKTGGSGRPPGNFSGGRNASGGSRKTPAAGRGLRVFNADRPEPSQNGQRPERFQRPRDEGPARQAPRQGPRQSDRRNGPTRMASPDPARHAAALLLWTVLEDRVTLDEAKSSSKPYAALDPRDRGFAAAIVMATLRRLWHVDGLIAQCLAKPLPETAHYVRALLRLSVGQWLAGLAPDHAIASNAVSLARADRVAHGMAGLVNAVIRRVQREVDPSTLRVEDALAPQWSARWSRHFGQDRFSALASALSQQPPLDLSAKHDFDPGVLADLEPIALSNGAIRLMKGPTDITSLPGWADGAIWVQDAAARLPVLALGDVAGKTVLDVCAAPGGKTMQLAAAGALVTALDTDPRRMGLVSENLSRTKLTATCTIADAREWATETLFDAVLLDAPCSATGTGRRHPEAQWIRDPRDVTRLLGIQSQLIARSAKLVKPGGVVVFSICSMEPEEQDAALAAAAGAGLVLQPLTSVDLPGLPEWAFRQGTVHTAPDVWAEQGGMDGFFIARFVRA